MDNLDKLFMSIKPFDFVILKNGDYFLVQSYAQRRVDENTVIPDLIVKGILLNKNSFLTDTFGVTGKTTKHFLNMKTASIPKIVKFMHENAHKFNTRPDGNDWTYLSDISTVISRKQDSVKLDKSVNFI